MVTEISSTNVQSRQACANALTSMILLSWPDLIRPSMGLPPAEGVIWMAGSSPAMTAGEGRNAIRLSEARLHAVSSRNIYSEHGFDARIAPLAGQVCQSLMVVWNWMPGSALAQAASAI